MNKMNGPKRNHQILVDCILIYDVSSEGLYD